MGGNSSGGSSEKIDKKKIEAAANAAITSAFSSKTQAFFFCEAIDSNILKDRITSSGKKTLQNIPILESPLKLDDLAIPDESIIILFTAVTSDDSFLNSVLTRFRENALSIRHVKKSNTSLIPSRVSLYRIPSITWEQFLEGIL